MASSDRRSFSGRMQRIGRVAGAFIAEKVGICGPEYLVSCDVNQAEVGRLAITTPELAHNLKETEGI